MISIMGLVLLVPGLAVQATFVHTGIIFTSEHIETMRANALSGNETWAASYASLVSNSRSSALYVTEGGGALIGYNSGNDTIDAWNTAWVNDCYAAWMNSLRYVINLDDAHAVKVAEIVDAWSGNLTGVVAGNNLPTALNGRQLVNAAELVYYKRGSWPSGSAKFARAQTMVSKHLVPNKDPVANPPNQPVVGGNQAALSHIAGMEFAIFTNNATGFQAELDILLLPRTACVGYEGSGMQALIHNKTGQCAEAGRDQGHSADEVGWLEEGARVAANQGDTSLFDLQSQDGLGTPLLMLGLEYYFKYNTGSDVSFDTTWGPCCCGTILCDEISNKSRSTAYPIGEIAYNYYATQGSGDYSMPSTKLWLQMNRPLKTSTNFGDFLIYPTLAWADSAL